MVKRPVNLTISTELVERLDAYLKSHGGNRSPLVERLLEDFLRQQKGEGTLTQKLRDLRTKKKAFEEQFREDIKDFDKELRQIESAVKKEALSTAQFLLDHINDPRWDQSGGYALTQEFKDVNIGYLCDLRARALHRVLSEDQTLKTEWTKRNSKDFVSFDFSNDLDVGDAFELIKKHSKTEMLKQAIQNIVLEDKLKE